MGKKTLHFHIGSHKTATTTLQNALAANGDLLARAGLLYPKSGRYFSGHHPLALQLRDPEQRNQPLEALGDWPELLREIDASPARDVLLSSENFEWLQDLSRLQGLSRRYRVRVLFYMRNPASYLESFYNQLVKDLKTREARTLETYICEHGLFFLDNERLLRRWSDTFGAPALQVRLYEKSLSAKTLLSQFLQMLGCQNPPRLVLPQSPALQKISLPPDALEYLRLRNLHRAPPKGQHRITMTLAQIAQTEAAALQRSRAGLLSVAAQQNLIRRFAAGNLRVARAWSADCWQRFEAEVQVRRPPLTLISSEHFSGLSDPSQLITRLQRSFSRITVLAYLRDPAELYCSTLQQRIRGNGDRLAALPSPLTFFYPARKQLEPFFKLVGPENMLVRRFGSNAPQDRHTRRDVVQDFFATLPALIHANASPASPGLFAPQNSHLRRHVKPRIWICDSWKRPPGMPRKATKCFARETFRPKDPKLEQVQTGQIDTKEARICVPLSIPKAGRARPSAAPARLLDLPATRHPPPCRSARCVVPPAESQGAGPVQAGL